MTDLQGTKWVLEVPFITAPGFTLDEECDAIFAGINAKLRPASFGYAKLIIDGLESAPAARKLFGSVRKGLLAASLNITGGFHVRDEVVTLSKGSPLPSQVDVPLIYQEDQNLSRLIVNLANIQFQFDKVWPNILKGVEFCVMSESAAKALANDRVELALELYADSYFEYSESARFLGLIGVLEVLKDQTSASKPAQELVDTWQAAVNALDAEEAVSIRGSLEWLRSISISRGIGSVVGRHLGPEPAREARILYGMRSDLVHKGKRPADPADILHRAEQIVTGLLARILITGSL